MMKALGDPTRLRIFAFLQSCCCAAAVGDDGAVRMSNGKSVGDVCCNVMGTEKVPSSLSFHLKELKNAGLILMEKRGKHVFCAVNRGAAETLAAYFAEACACVVRGDNPSCCDC